MAIKTSGITISIQAKVEGWQAELKRIQEEAKKVNLGTEFGRDLSKNIAALDKQINSMAQNLTHRLTSDTGIDNFSDKLNDIETQFRAIGDAMSSITFSDLDASYVEPQLKSLLDRVTELQTKLNTELDTKFGDDIVKEATKIQKAFSRVGQSEEDIKKLGREGTRAALQGIVESSTKTIDQANQKIENLRNNINQLKEAEKTWQPSKFAQENDINKYISSTVSTDASAYGLKPVINEQALEEIKIKINNAINEIKLSDSKKQEIEKYLNELVPTSSVEIINKRMQNIRQVLSNTPGLSAFGLDKESFSGYLKQIINETDINALDTSLNRIKERFIADGINEEDLNKFWGTFSDSIKNQDFDKAIELVSTNLTQLQEEYKKGKEKIVQARKELEEVLKQTQSDQFKAAWTRTFGEEGLKELDELIEKAKLASSTFKELTSAEKEVKEKRQELVQPVQTVGREVSDTAIKNWYENTAAAQVYNAQLDQIKSREKMLGKIEGLIQRWFSVYAVVRMVNQAIHSVINTVQELDQTITEIAIVTKMDQGDLWGQMDSYTNLARQYAASISGVYKVSQLYYQQGLQTAEVMELTEQTLKMARISGLDYAQATDYMTNAIRSFKMEMSDAQSIVDVYSAIAAASATDTTELASAMSKTASSAQAVGSSFENTTAMMAVMIEATRESAENIGSAMKSIISRYGEMTSNPAALVDSEGQEMSLNRVDKALQTVGISIHNAAGEFRDFDDVIMELAEKWDTIDTNTQRYIATIMAGNRQQSRFLALVSSYDRLKELSEEAANSENAAQLQFLKTLDSVGAKTQQLQTSLQSLYTASGIEKTYKTILDLGNSVVQTFTSMETLGGFPVLAITRLGTTFASLALIITNIFRVIKTQYSLNLKELEMLQADYLNRIKPLKEKEVELERQIAADKEAAQKAGIDKELENVRNQISQEEKLYKDITKRRSATKISMTTGQKVGMGLSTLGMIGTTIASGMNQDTQKDVKGWTTIGSSILSGVGTAALMGSGPLGILMGVATSLSGILEGIGILTETVDEKVNKLKSDIETTSNSKLQSKDQLKTLTDYKKKYDELSQAQYQSTEDKKAFIDIQNEIAASYPELISSMDSEGNYIVNMTTSYQQLAAAKMEAYKQTYLDNINAEVAGLSNIAYVMKSIFNANLGGSHNGINDFFQISNNIDLLYEKLAKGQNIAANLNDATIKAMFGGDMLENNTDFNNLLSAALDNDPLNIFGKIFGTEKITYSRARYAELIQQFYDAAEEGFTLEQAKTKISSDSNNAQYIQAIENFSSEAYKNFIITVESARYATDRLNSYFYSAASEWANVLNNVSGIETTDLQSAIISDRIAREWEAYQKDAEDGSVTLLDGTIKTVNKINDKYIDIQGKEQTWNISDQYQEFLEQYTELWYIGAAKSLDYLQSDNIDELYANRGQYTKDQIKSMSAYQKLGDATEEFWKLYDKDFKDNIDEYINFLKDDSFEVFNETDTLAALNNFKDQFGPIFLDAIRSQYQKILNNDGLTQDQRTSQVKGLTTAIQSLQSLSFEDQAKAMSMLATADLSSLFGISDFLRALQQNNIDIDSTGIITAFDNFSNTLILNLTAELDNYSSKIKELSTNYNKALSSATKGMDLPDAIAAAGTYGISLSDFKYVDGTFFLNNFELIEQYYIEAYNAFTTRLEEQFTERLSRLQALRGKTWGNISWNNVFNKTLDTSELETFFNEERNQQNFLNVTGIDYNEFLTLYKQYKNSSEIDFFSFLENDTTKTLDIYKQYFKDKQKEAQQNAIKTSLTNNDIETFANLVFANINEAFAESKQELINELLKSFDLGELDNILNLILQFAPESYQLVKETFENSVKDIYDSFSLEGATKLIKGNALNKGELEYLSSKGLAVKINDANGELLYELVEITEDNIDTYIEVIKKSDLTSSEKAAQLSKAHEFKYPDKIQTLTDILSESEIDYNSAQNLAQTLGYTADQAEQAMLDLGFILNESTGKWRRGATSLEKIEARIEELKNSATLEDLNELKALEDVALDFSESQKSQAISDIFKDYRAITPEILANFATAFGQDYDELKTEIAQDNFDGTFSLDVGAIRDLLNTESLEDSTRNLLETLLSGIADDYLNAINNASNLVTTGTNKQADIQNFINDYNKTTDGAVITANEAFQWDKNLNNYTLNSQYLLAYINQKRTEMLEDGFDLEFVEGYINSIFENIRETVNIENFLKAENKGANSKAREILKKQMTDSLISTQSEITDELIKSIEEEVESDLDLLELGGKEAVAVLKKYAGNKELTAAELDSAYNARLNAISSVMERLPDLKVGSIVDNNTAQILSWIDGFSIDADGLIISTGNLVEAYKTLYSQMKLTNVATIAALNESYAQLLNAEDQQNIDITETLKNGNGMSYADFGNLLAKYDIKFEDYMTDHWDTVMRDGFGNIRITDWEGFAKNVFKTENLDAIRNTDEYISAFKAYNDGLIELNKDTEQAIADELKQIENAKAGDWLNLTEFGEKYREARLNKDFSPEFVFSKLNHYLNKWGASFEDGILKIGDESNLIGIAQALEQAAADAGLEIGNGLEQVKDTVVNILKSYSDAIVKGISGGLSNTEAADLIKKADNLGISNLHFQETTEGLKLAQESAIQLYLELSQVDKLQGQIVFDKLNESLKENNEHFTTTSALLNRIKTLTEAIVTGSEKINGVDQKVSEARLNQYKAELEVAKEIAAVRSAAEDESFNFMSNKIPAGQNNPLNYVKNWAQALKSIQEAYKVNNTWFRDKEKGHTRTGYMGYEDFYNVINEINNMAGIMKKPITIGKTIKGDAITLDGTLTSASDAIMHGIDTLTVVDTGDMMVNIGALGINLAKGGKEMKNGIKEGIDAVADAQIEALDGMIAMLELIVAMEDLGDVAGEDMKIELPEIAIDTDNDGKLDTITDTYAAWLQKFDHLYETNKDLRKTVDGISVNGKKWRDMLHQDAKDWTEQDAQILNALYQAAISTDWNLDDIGGSLQKLLNSGEFGKFADGFTINVGNVAYTISHGVVIKAVEWEEPSTQEILKQYMAETGKDEDTAKENILKAIQAYLDGKGYQEDLGISVIDYIKIRHSTLIKKDENGKDYIEGPNGKKYYSDDDGWYAAIESAILSDQQGIDSKDIHLNGKDTYAEVTYGIKKQSKFKVTADDQGKVEWGLDSKDPLFQYLDKTKSYSSQDELLHAIYKGLNQAAAYDDDYAKSLVAGKSFDQFIDLHYGLHLRVNTEVYKEGADGKKAQLQDPTKDPVFKKSINDALSGTKDWKYENIAGKVMVTLPYGYTLQFDADEVTVDGKENKELIEQKIREAGGFDTAMKEVVTQGVTEGMTQAFSNLKVTEADVDVSGIEKITSSLIQAKEAAGELVDALKNLSPKQPSGQQAPEVDANYLKVHAKEMRLAENLDGSGKIKLPDNTKVTSEDDIKVVTTGQVIPDTTAWPIDLGNAPLKVGTFFTVTTPIILKLKNIIPELASDALADTDALVQGIEGKMSSLSTNWETYLTSMEGSVTSHFSTMMAQAVAAIGVIYALLMSLQRKVSITWSLNVDSNIPGLENGNYAGWGSGNPDYTGFATNYAEMFSELHQSIVDAVVSLLNEPEKETSSVPVDADTESAKEKVQEVKDEASQEATTPVTANTDEAKSKLDELNSEIETPVTKPVEFQGNPDSLQSQLDNTSLTVQVQFKGSGSPFPAKMMEQATGNVGLAKSKGTLMGELGPELVVSNGRYFVAGQNGAEMVNLADDAIVFNHLQTEQLLKHGMSSGRGRAVTNERNAVAFAQGNINGGPAMASASAALAALKQLRQMWESLRAMSIQDLAKNAGGGGGGGGNEKIVDPSIWIDTVERWYNLTQEIAKLEKQITHEEVLRSKLQSDFQKNGKAYYRSQKDSLDSLRQQIAAQEQLNLSHEEYYDRRVEALERSPFGKIMEFDNEGQMHFKEGQMEWLTDLVGFDSNKGANYTDEQKYNKLVEMGFADYMKYDSNGAEIIMDADHSGDITDEERQSYYQNATQAWWDKLNDYRDTTQSAWDTIQEGRDKLLELQTAENEILQEMRDNQIDMENQVLDAIVDMREREIDALQDERDKLEESVNKYVDGLSNALDKEQKMYQNQESQNDLDKQRRRLAILQRSGGSASDIASLQNDINQSERDMYFDLQQQQIDAIQEASQLELERMDTQIEIMNETLEFQKEYGLLWEEVYSIMGGSAQQIADFISGNSEFWSKSPLAQEMALNDVVFGADQWVAFRKDTGLIRDALQQQVQEADFKIYNDAMIKEFGQDYDKSGKYAKIFNDTYANSRDITEASTAARSAYTADKLAAEKAERDRIAAENAAKAQQTQTTATTDNNNNNNQPISIRFTNYEHNAGYHWRYSIYSDGSRNRINYGPHSLNANGVCTICGCKTNKTPDKKKLRAGEIPAAASGGYVNHGIYELGERGTETVLTASQTKVLRDNILSNRPSSLISLLKTYNEGFSQNHLDSYSKDAQALYNSISNNDGINIENATVNMNVQQLANDYDAKRAGEQALAEIMRIARKTSANNSIRR